MVWPAVIAAGASLAGGILNRNAAKSAASTNAAMQREFAQHGIRWKVQDAKAAGLHPLYALGANTHASSPVSVGSGRYGIGHALRDVGQDVSRAVAAAETAQEREIASLNVRSVKLDVEGKEIENAIRASELQKMSQVGPALPSVNTSGLVISGQGDTYGVEKQRVTSVSKSNPSQFAGGHAGTSFTRTDSGGLKPVMADSGGAPKDDMDITDFNALDWITRNRLIPVLSGITPPSVKDFPLPRGYSWKWRPSKQQFMPYKKGEPFYGYQKLLRYFPRASSYRGYK